MMGAVEAELTPSVRRFRRFQAQTAFREIGYRLRGHNKSSPMTTAQKPASIPPRRSYARRLALLRKATRNPAHIVDRYLSLLGKYARKPK
jgi:hypothetical protein